MKKPVLVVMAAGMGSRYGGLKQILLSKKKMKQTSEAPSVTVSVTS